MNPKIEQLAETAVSKVQNRPNGTCDMNKYNQAFADLIIEEIESYIAQCEGDVDFIRFLIDTKLKNK